MPARPDLEAELLLAMACHTGSKNKIVGSSISTESLKFWVLLLLPTSPGNSSTDQLLRNPAAGAIKSQRLIESNSDGRKYP